MKNNNNTQIVWVFGGSGAGKETFIKFVQKNKTIAIAEKLGWNNKNIVVCKESIEWVAQSDDDPLGPKREELLSVIPEYVSNNEGSVILIKGQDFDLKNNRLRKIKKMLPDCKHNIIFIHGAPEEHFERWKSSKKWCQPEYTAGTVKQWLVSQINLLSKLKNDFTIMAIDGGKGKSYKVIELPF